MDITNKERTIATVFYNARSGFGSLEHTWKAAHLINRQITRADVRSFLAKQEVRQRKKPHKVNSFVANFPRQEFQVDLLDMGERANPRYFFCHHCALMARMSARSQVKVRCQVKRLGK